MQNVQRFEKEPSIICKKIGSPFIEALGNDTPKPKIEEEKE